MWRSVVLVIALAACRDRDGSDKSAPAPQASGAVAIDASADRLGPGPALAVADAAPATDAALPAFADELRDDAWATPLEAALRSELATGPAIKNIDAECRASQCRLNLEINPGGGEAAAKAVEQVLRAQDATGVVFDTATGERIVVYARFAR